MIFHGHTGNPSMSVRPYIRPYIRPSVRVHRDADWLIAFWRQLDARRHLKTENYKFLCSFNLQNLKILFWKPLLNLAIFLDIMLCQSWCVKAKISYVWTSFPARCRFKHCSMLERRRRTQITFSKLDDFFVEFVATKKLLVIAESLRICLKISVKSGIKDRLH